MSIDIKLAQSILVSVPKLSNCDIYVTLNAAVSKKAHGKQKV
jgi:hypothetical protein